MNKTDFKNEWATLTNQTGFIGTGGWTQNDALWHAFYVDSLEHHGFLGLREVEENRKLYSSLMREPGLLMRNPDGSGGTDSHDNTKAALWMCHLLGINYAEMFLWYGRNQPATSYQPHRTGIWNTISYWVLNIFGGFLGAKRGVPYTYNCEKPRVFDLSCFHGRFQEMVAQAKILAGEPLNKFQKWYLIYMIRTSANHGSIGGKRVEATTLMYWVCKSARLLKDPDVDKAVDYWNEKKQAAFPNGFADVFRDWGPNWKKRKPWMKYLTYPIKA